MKSSSKGPDPLKNVFNKTHIPMWISGRALDFLVLTLPH